MGLVWSMDQKFSNEGYAVAACLCITSADATVVLLQHTFHCGKSHAHCCTVTARNASIDFSFVKSRTAFARYTRRLVFQFNEPNCMGAIAHCVF